MLLETGLRVSEFCGMTVDDIDFSTNTLQVKRQIIYRKIGGVYRSNVQTPKTAAGYRPIPLSASAVQSLHNLIARADLNVKVDGVTKFVMARNSYECKAESVERWIRTVVRRIRKKHPSFPDVTPHILRHTFCTNLFRLGINPKAIQKIMGHTNISTTLDIYTHMEDEAIKSQIDELGDSISFTGTRFRTNEALSNKKSMKVAVVRGQIPQDLRVYRRDALASLLRAERADLSGQPVGQREDLQDHRVSFVHLVLPECSKIESDPTVVCQTLYHGLRVEKGGIA